MKPLPKSAQVHVNSAIAKELFNVSNKTPKYIDKQLRNVEIQSFIRSAIRSACKDGFDSIVAEIREKLDQIPYCVCLKGLKFDKNYSLYIALSTALGNAIEPYNQPWSKLIHHLQPAIEWKGTILDTLNENLHTDGTNWLHPNDFTCLLCIRPDQYGGARSRILDRDSILNELRDKFGKKVVNILHNDPVPWRIADEITGGVVWLPVLTSSTVRWMRYTIDKAIEEGKLDPLPRRIREAVDAMDNVTAKSGNIIDFMLNAGELLIIDNKRSLHARSAYLDPRSSERLVLRLKIESSTKSDNIESINNK